MAGQVLAHGVADLVMDPNGAVGVAQQPSGSGCEAAALRVGEAAEALGVFPGLVAAVVQLCALAVLAISLRLAEAWTSAARASVDALLVVGVGGMLGGLAVAAVSWADAVVETMQFYGGLERLLERRGWLVLVAAVDAMQIYGGLVSLLF